MLAGLYDSFGKRLFDSLLAVPVLIILSPLLLLVAVLVRLDSPGPVFFVQERLGRRGKVFRAYKFRTMTHRLRTCDHEIIGPDSEVTSVGRWLRRFKLDECPQLLNVLKADMSIVGPRPALPTQLSEYDHIARRRLMVRPGLTGLAQVSGNIYLSWPDRWRYDVTYVDHMSIWLDLQIICRTIAVVIAGEDRFLKQPPGSPRKT